MRVPLCNSAARIERAWRLLHEERGLEPLLLSASREEAFAADHPPLAKTASPQTVLVVSPGPAYWRYLNELLAFSGHTFCLADPPAHVSQPTAILFDADPWDEARADQLRSLRQRHPTVNTIALMSLPHPEHEAAIIGLGISTLMPKLGDQVAIMNAVCGTRPPG